jgi:DNA recombination protein RmuC
MFVPLESALYAALKENTDLYRIALEKNIVLVSVTTLITTMRTVSFMWKQENQKNNVLEIARQSGALYDKFVGFISDLDGIGQSIDKAHKNFMDAKNKLHEGRGNIVNKIESIKKLGAKAEKSLPKEVVDKSENSFLELMD